MKLQGEYFETLVALADRLDSEGRYTEVNAIDKMFERVAAGTEPLKDPENLKVENLGKVQEELTPPNDADKLLHEYKNIANGLKSAVEKLKLFGEHAKELEDNKIFALCVHLANEIENAIYGPADSPLPKKTLDIGEDLGGQSINSLIESKIGEKVSYAQDEVELFNKLSEVADKLDSIGAAKEADVVDGFISKYADILSKAKPKTKKTDEYDSKGHHSEQIREPKKPGEETVDREGRKDHHVHTYQQTGAISLSTRYCPEHVGVTLGRISDGTFQCPLDGAVYNWEAGWTDYDGNQHPGGSVAAQTPESTEYAIPHRIFDSREKILNTIN
jgi:hypothetical protein